MCTLHICVNVRWNARQWSRGARLWPGQPLDIPVFFLRCETYFMYICSQRDLDATRADSWADQCRNSVRECAWNWTGIEWNRPAGLHGTALVDDIRSCLKNLFCVYVLYVLYWKLLWTFLKEQNIIKNQKYWFSMEQRVDIDLTQQEFKRKIRMKITNRFVIFDNSFVFITVKCQSDLCLQHGNECIESDYKYLSWTFHFLLDLKEINVESDDFSNNWIINRTNLPGRKQNEKQF